MIDDLDRSMIVSTRFKRCPSAAKADLMMNTSHTITQSMKDGLQTVVQKKITVFEFENFTSITCVTRGGKQNWFKNYLPINILLLRRSKPNGKVTQFSIIL